MKEMPHFRLYTAGETPNSKRARANLTAACQAHLGNECDIEVIDVLLQPHRARLDRVRVTPTLIIIAGSLQRRLVGTLSNASELLDALGLASVAA